MILLLFMSKTVLSMFSSESFIAFSLTFRSSAHFLIGLFVFLILSCMSCLYILETNPLPVPLFANIFSHSMDYLFFFFMVSFAVQKLKAFFFSLL